MPLGPSSGGIGPECSRGSPGSLWSPGERVCALPQLQREAKKKKEYFFFLRVPYLIQPQMQAMCSMVF